MGDMADMYLDSALAYYEDTGEMGPEPDYVPRRRRGPTVKTCRYCGVGGLHWRRLEGEQSKWRLFDRNNKLHSCL